MPIKNLSDQLRLPRLGKIHLGIKKLTAKGVEYPTATDYFVCPPEVTMVFGDQPKGLDIYIPVEDAEYWASQYYRAYSSTRGLICKGDGENCQRMIDLKTNEIAGKDAAKVAWQPLPCPGRDCELYKQKKCGEMMCLQFMLPDVPGVGVWQIDTGSINSIRNINSEATMIRQVCGRINMLPLRLTLEGAELPNPDTGKKRMHYLLHLRERDTLHKLLDDSRKPLYELLAPPVADLEEAARDIETLWPEDKPKPTNITFPRPATADLTEKYKDAPLSTPDNATKQGTGEQVGEITAEPAAGAVTAGTQALIDLPWLKERLTELKWKNSEVIAWIAGKQIFKGVDLTGSLSLIVGRLSKDQAAALVAEIEDRLLMS